MRTSKIINILLLTTVSGGILLTSSCSGGKVYAQPAQIAQNTQSIVQDSKSESTKIFDEIQHNIDLVSSLKTKVQQTQAQGTTVALGDIISDVKSVTESYESLASQRDDIKKTLMTQIIKVDNMRKSIDSQVSSLKLKQADYLHQASVVTDPNPEIVRVRKAALTKAANYTAEQITLWIQFSSIERDITLQLADVESTIDSFLSMIQSTAIVFREGLNLLELQKDINDAVSLVSSDLPRMQQLTQDMESSWDNLDSLVSMLTGVAKITQ